MSTAVRVVAYVILVVGIVMATWGLAGVLDRRTRSEDDWPLLRAGVIMLVLGTVAVRFT